MIEVNLVGLMKMTHAMLPFLARNQSGHVVNIASLAGRIANPGASGYAASKFGVVGFSESLRRELVARAFG
jgi:short-subunit dehydrogenase